MSNKYDLQKRTKHSIRFKGEEEEENEIKPLIPIEVFDVESIYRKLKYDLS